MRAEWIAAAGLAGLVALPALRDSLTPQVSPAQQEYMAVQRACEKLNTRFVGSRDALAQHRVDGCVMAVYALKTLQNFTHR